MCEVIGKELRMLNNRESASEAKGVKLFERELLGEAQRRWVETPSGSKKKRMP
jgi:hypothetical protein